MTRIVSVTAVCAVLIGSLILGAAANEAQPDPAHGEKIYQALCTQCHGVNGNGWGINAEHMEVKPRNHTDYKEMAARTDDDLIKVIGRGGVSINKSVLMPAWRNNLTESDIRDVVAHVRGLCCTPEAAKAAAQRTGPVPADGKLAEQAAEPPPPIEIGGRFEPESAAEPSLPLPERIDPSVPFHHFEMTIEELVVTVAPGFTSKVWAFNGQVPGPLLHVGEGDEVVVNVTNNTTLNHTVHWHGTFQTNTWRSDGVPMITQKPIEPGETFQYHFLTDKTGSLWYHCHVNVPEHVGLRGMWGPMIVDPKQPDPIEKEVTKDAILMFTGWNSDVAMAFGEGGHPRELPNYFSINARSFPGTSVLRVKKGDVLRLRLYAASVETSFHMHGHDMLVTHKDGLPLDSPYWADVVPVPMGGRVDVIMRMDNPGRWISHDHIEHHVSNNGVTPGGSVFIIEYEDVDSVDDEWYALRGVKPVPDFYFSESLLKPHGLHMVPEHRGYTFKEIGAEAPE